MCQDPVLLGGEEGLGVSLDLCCLPMSFPEGLPGPLGSAPASFCRDCSPGTMLGEAKGTAWPESCWSLVTCAKKRGQESEEAQFGKGCLGLRSLTSAEVTAPY